MSIRKKSIALFATALCLAWSLSVAGLAFADDTASLTGGVIAENPVDGSAATEPEPEPVHADGWEKVDSSWTYWKNNEQVKGAFVTTANGPAISGIPAGSHKYWIAQDGKLAMSRLVNPTKANDRGAKYYYYATKRGYVATGKTRVGDLIYLANSKTGRLESGNSQGFLTTKKYDGGTKRRYYINPKTHAITTGKPVKVKGFGWVFAYPNKGYLLTGLKKVDSTHVVLASNTGKLRNKAGWVSTNEYTGKDKQRYYLNHTKKYKNLYGARIGMFKVDGKRYLGESKGYVYRNGYKLMNNKYYYADGKGALVYNSVITHMFRKAQGYSSPSQYLIMVDVNDTKFMVFTGKQGNWQTKYIWDCSTGHPSTPTPIGVWHVGIKGYSFGHGYTCYYYTQFNGDYLIHTRIYQEGTHILRDAAMNTQVSQGCVRLYDEDAYWVYKNIPEGTTVVTIP